MIVDDTYSLYLSTWWGSHPCQTQHPIIKISIGENISQAVVIVVLLRVQLQELLHTNVGKAEWVGPIPLIAGSVYLQRSIVIRGRGGFRRKTEQIQNILLKWTQHSLWSFSPWSWCCEYPWSLYPDKWHQWPSRDWKSERERRYDKVYHSTSQFIMCTWCRQYCNIHK